MRTLALFLFILLLSPGCSESKPDPRDHPDFVDTSDPSNLRMPGATSPAKPEKDAKAKE